MTGCIFWGATYCFARNPGIENLVQEMRRLGITAFISIPMKWMQLYDLVRQNVDVVTADDEEIEAAVRETVGKDLRWGLSAAGYLDPEIFRFFQRHGTELMSGFGMTEATGGITMTPPGRYKEDSLGPALPGIEMTLADDGELKIRGPYVMQGLLNPPEGISAVRHRRVVSDRRSHGAGRGWFHPHRRPQERDLQKHQRSDHRPAEDREPLPRFRFGRTGFPGR